jgi:heptaprenyl diphosphate synthase
VDPRTPFLDLVEARLEAVLRVDPQADDAETERLVEAARGLCLAGGKRARPWLVGLLGGALGAPEDALVDLAVAAECIHAASLLHDDVVDEGTERRGRPTANARWGNLAAVLSGDLVLTVALAQLRRHPPALHHVAVDTVAAMTRATLREAGARSRIDLTPARWRQIAWGKTGALFGFCGAGAGLLAGDAEAADRLRLACGHLGVGFQLSDDLADLCGWTVGKAPGADLRNRNPTLPLLLAARDHPEVQAALLQAWAHDPVRPDDAARVAALVQATDAVPRTLEALAFEVAGAETALAPWTGHPEIGRVLVWARALVPEEDTPCVAR